MRRALRLGARARGRTAPNPPVGALVVRDGAVLGEGYHARAGAPHAEVIALDRAGAAARGAVLYVTLEPCAHRGRTPPCVERVIEAGPARVVVGMRDPDSRTDGRGIARLRAARVPVELGVEELACRTLTEGFRSRIERGRPFTTLKLAASLDGRIATASGESRWITGERARRLVHGLRARSDAVLVGSRTARADDPELVARRGARVVHRPVRIVVDSRLRLPRDARLLDPERAGSAWLLTTREAAARRGAALERAGARVIPVRAREGRVDLAAAWRRLAELGINDLLVEGGGTLGAALLRTGLVDRLWLFLAPLLIGADGRPLLGPLGVEKLADASRPARTTLRRVGEDVLLVAEW